MEVAKPFGLSPHSEHDDEDDEDESEAADVLTVRRRSPTLLPAPPDKRGRQAIGRGMYPYHW